MKDETALHSRQTFRAILMLFFFFFFNSEKQFGKEYPGLLILGRVVPA